MTNAALHQFYCWKESKVVNLQAPLSKINMKQEQFFFPGDTAFVSTCERPWQNIWEPDFPLSEINTVWELHLKH